MAWMSNHVQLKIMGVITYPSVLETEASWSNEFRAYVFRKKTLDQEI